ncbi:MAG: Sulfotransferase [Pedosphaera sp.]|nr:Sulfotransferase [Pedosphaera sp.]
MKLKRQPQASQGSLSRMFQAAQESWNRHDYQQSFDIMERASRLDPANHRVLLDLGSAYGIRYDYAAAERCFERAIRVAPHKSDALVMAGTYCRNFNRYELARHYFERAAEQKDASADTFVKLAEIYERFRRLEDAAAMIDRALKLDGTCALALLVRARLARLAGRGEDAERLLRPLLALTDQNSWSTRIRGWYELGAVLDLQGRYDDAMAAFITAKEMLRPNAAHYIASQQSIHAHLQEAAANISGEVLRRWFEFGGTLQPPRRLALLCGHPRSGTTLLEQVLDSHPDVISAEETPIFFETYLALKLGARENASMLSVLESASPAGLRQARENYFHCMQMFHGNPIANRLLIDKNPSLTTLVPAFLRVLPETKFLVALRDPRDVCLSFFMQPLPLNLTSASYLTLEGTFDEYASLMGIWRAMASRMPNPQLEVRYEEMVGDLEPVARRVLEFLGVPWNECVLRFNEHARQKLVRSPTYADVTKPIFKGAIGRWRNYQKHLEPWLEKLKPFVKAFGYE